MKTDLSEQIHDLMERGVRPVSMADIESRSPVRVTIARRSMARSRHGRLLLAGAAVAAACAALLVTVLLPGSGTGGSTGQPRLAAWTVTKQQDGSVMVTLHQVRAPAKLQQTLRADGIPAKVFVNRQKVENSLDVPGCRVYPSGGPGGTPPALWQRVFYGTQAHADVRSWTFWVYPSALPHGQGVVIVISYGPAKLSNTNHRVGADLGYGVDSYSLYLVNASPPCTGS